MLRRATSKEKPWIDTEIHPPTAKQGSSGGSHNNNLSIAESPVSMAQGTNKENWHISVIQPLSYARHTTVQ
jgi:hypothetical protein